MPTGPISGTKFIFSVHVYQVPKSSSKRSDNLKNIFLVTKVLLIILFMYGRLNVFFLKPWITHERITMIPIFKMMICSMKQSKVQFMNTMIPLRQRQSQF